MMTKTLTDAQVVEGAWKLIRKNDLKDSLPARYTLLDLYRASQQLQQVAARFFDAYGERLEKLDQLAHRELLKGKRRPIYMPNSFLPDIASFPVGRWLQLRENCRWIRTPDVVFVNKSCRKDRPGDGSRRGSPLSYGQVLTPRKHFQSSSVVIDGNIYERINDGEKKLKA